MYNNVGNKIKVLAKIIGWLLLIAGLVVWYLKICANHYMGDDLIGWVALAVGVLSLISSWPIYAFGQLVDDTNAIRRRFEEEKGTEEKAKVTE